MQNCARWDRDYLPGDCGDTVVVWSAANIQDYHLQQELWGRKHLRRLGSAARSCSSCEDSGFICRSVAARGLSIVVYIPIGALVERLCFLIGRRKQVEVRGRWFFAYFSFCPVRERCRVNTRVGGVIWRLMRVL